MREETFLAAVEIARDIIRQTEEALGPSTAKAVARFWDDCDPSAGYGCLETLIWCSEEIAVAWDSVSLVAERLLRENERLPPELARWVADRLAGGCPRPTKRGPDPDTNLARDRGIVDAVQWLVQSGFSATRSKNRGPHASFDGQSACDAVGAAAHLSYSRVEGIWTSSAASDSPIRRRPFDVIGVTGDSPPRAVVSFKKHRNEEGALIPQ